LMSKESEKVPTVSEILYRMKFGDESNKKENLAIKNLFPIFDRDGDLTLSHGVSSLNKRRTTFETNLLIEAFRELYNEGSPLPDAFIKIMLLQSGVSTSPISFQDIVPFEKFAELVKPMLDAFLTNARTNLTMEDFPDMFYRNNSNNGLMVPYESPFRVNSKTGRAFPILKKKANGQYSMDISGRQDVPYVLTTAKDAFTEEKIAILLKNTGRAGKYGNVFEQAIILGSGMYLLEYFPSLEEALGNKEAYESIEIEAPTIPSSKKYGAITGTIAAEETTDEKFGFFPPSPQKSEKGIHFINRGQGYKPRTRENASADMTIAVASDFSSSGEILTKTSVEEQKKIYVPIDISSSLEFTKKDISDIVSQLNKVPKLGVSINLAGNGIYTFAGKYTQKQLDTYMYNLLEAIQRHPNLNKEIIEVRSGGQTGIDEAGAKAGARLGINTIVLAPADWAFRPKHGQDIRNNEQAFKARFSTGFFQAEGTEGIEISEEDNKQLERKIKTFLAKIGVNYQPTTQIFDDAGNPVEAIAKAEILKKILYVIEGKATVDSLPEEAAHFFVEMLTDNVLLDGMLKDIEFTQVYDEIFEAYNKLYEGDVNKIKKEAVGKLITAYIMREIGANNAVGEAWIADIEKKKGLLSRIWTWLKKKFAKMSGDEVSTTINGFEASARQILAGDTANLATEAADVTYHAEMVNDVSALKEKFPPVHPNEFYHHSTISFRPKSLEGMNIGSKGKVKIIGRLTTDKVDVLLVENPKSTNKDAHITLSTAVGVKPFESNSEIEANRDKIVPITGTVSVTEGYFDSKRNRSVVEGASFYQAKTPAEIAALANNLSVSSTKIVGDDTDTEYVVGGKKGFERTTTYTKRIQGRSYDDASKRQKAGWAIDATTGTLVHGIAGNIIKTHFPEQNRHVDVFTNEDVQGNASLMAIRKDLEKELMPLIQEVKASGGYLLSELKTSSQKKTRAGTQDLVEVRGDGRGINIYDFKTKSSGRISAPQEREYTAQLNDYTDMSEEGDATIGRVPVKVIQKRIIPISKKYQYALRKTLIAYLEENLNSFEKQDLAPYRKHIYRVLEEAHTIQDPITGGMTQIPIISENVDDKDLDKLINKLYTQIKNEERRYRKTRDAVEKENLTLSIATKRDLIKTIQLRQDIGAVAVSASRDINYILNRVNSEDFDFNKEFMQLSEVAKLYSNLQDYINIKKLDEKTKAQVRNVVGKAKEALKSVRQRGIDIIKQAVEEEIITEGSGIIDADEAMEALKGTNWWQYLTQGIGSTHNPLLATVKKKVDLALGRARENTRNLNKKIAKAADRVEKATGLRGPKAYVPFLQTNAEGKLTGNIVLEYKPEYWKRKQEATSEGDIEWMQENTVIDNDHFVKRQEAFNDHLKQLMKAEYRTKLEEFDGDKQKAEKSAIGYAKVIQAEWNLKYMIDGLPNILYFNQPKDIAKWKDPKYATIMGNPALKEFYELYMSVIAEAKETLPVDLRRNFLPNYTASFLELVGHVGLKEATKGMSKRMISRLEAGADPWVYGMQTPSGEEVNEIPVSGIMPMDNDTKSFDLKQVLAVFGESMYRHQELERIHDLVLAVNDFVKDQVDGQGEGQFDSETGERLKDERNQPRVWSNKTGSAAHKQLQDFIDAIFYGKSRNDKALKKKMPNNKITKAIGINDKTLNLMKVPDGILVYTALKNLGLNMFSPTVNLLQGTTSALIEGAGGKYYSAKDFLKAAQLITTNDTKTWAIIKEFQDVPQREFTTQMRKQMSSVKGGKISGTEALFKLQELGEVAVQFAVMIAVMKGRQAEKFGIKFEDIQIVDGKVVMPKDLTVDQKTIFTTRVKKLNKKIVGNYDPDDRMAIKRYFGGRAIIQHRTWLPAMFENRFGSEKYDFILDEMFIGRYQATLKAAYWKVLLQSAKTGFFFTSFDQLQKDSGQDEQYVHAVRANLMELVLIGAVMLLTKGLAAGDDEDQTGVEKYLLRTGTRLLSEMMFFMSFTQALEILQSPAPSIAVYEEFFRWMKHMQMEVWGGITHDQMLLDKATPWKYTKRQFPVVGQIDRFIEFMETDEN